MDEAEIECIAIHEATNKCSFFKDTPACKDIAEGYFDYMYFIFCSVPPDYSWTAILTCVLWLLLLFVGLGVTADDFLCPSLVVITKTLHLSQNIAGVTFLAFGNGAPDIFSSVAGANQNRPGLVIGTLLGAGVFVTSVVVGSIIATKPFKIMERPFLRDTIFYLCAAFWAFLRVYYEELTLLHAIGFIVLYIIYILVVIISRIIYNRYREKSAPKIPEIEIQSPTTPGIANTEEEKKVTFKPDGIDDDPEAQGIVLRRASAALSYAINSMGAKTVNDDRSDSFSFRGSISVPKKRASSSHSHHEHVIKALTQSVENRPNLAYKNGVPPPLDTQISKTSLSSLLSSVGQPSILLEFLYQVSPIDIEAWTEISWHGKIFEVIKAPVCFLLILTVPVVDYENDKNNWCRPLNILHCITAPMFITFALSYQNLAVGPLPLWSIVFIASVILSVIVFFTSTNDTFPIYHGVFGYIGFVTSVIWVYVIASEIVSLLKTMGIIFKLSDAILGLTVLAWGNSIGDFISNLSVARQGYPRMGISACYGGPLLNLLLGIGIPFTIHIVTTNKPIEFHFEKLIPLLYGSITIILLTTIITMTALRFEAKRYFGFVLVAMYGVFLTTAILFETGVL